jgi:hypothetical protein
MRDTHESGGFGVCCGFGEAREEPSRRRRYAVARFDAANEPHVLLGLVI